MLKDVETIVKKSFKKNKNTIYIVVILLITSTFLIQSMPYPLVKPFHNRIINIGLIIGIMIHIYYKNACLAFLLLLTFIVINYYGVTKQKVYSYNNTHTDKYLIEDNSIFSNIKLLFNNHSEYFTEFVEGGRSTSLVPVNNSTKITLEQLSRSTSTTLPSSTASSTASPTTTDNTPRSPPLPRGFSSNGKPPPVTAEAVASAVAVATATTGASTASPTATAPPTATAEGRVNGGFMGAELFSAQNNVVPESTKVDNVQQPLEGINEYGCGGGNILNTDSPMGFDPKCQMNCSNV